MASCSLPRWRHQCKQRWQQRLEFRQSVDHVAQQAFKLITRICGQGVIDSEILEHTFREPYGDEMNEAARIEACATGGRALASKSLIERLTRTDADALGLAAARATYTPLADLATATDKARRDAPSISVSEV